MSAQTDLNALFNQALQAHHAGQLDIAASLYRQILSLSKTQFDSLHMLGVLEGQRGNLAEGARLIAKAIKINPNSADAYLNLGRLQGELEDLADAEKNLRKALALGPESALAYCNLSAVLDRLEQPVEALAAADRALALAPADIRAHFNRANALYRLRRYEEAEALYKRILLADPNNAEAWFRLAKTSGRMNDLTQAMFAFEKTAQLTPALKGLWLAQGKLFSKILKYDDALAAYDRELAIEPSSADAWIARGEVLGKLKRHDEARNAFDSAIRADRKAISAVAYRAWAKMAIYDWKDIESDLAALFKQVRKSQLSVDPLAAMRVNASNEDLFNLARTTVKTSLPPIEAPASPPVAKPADRIKVAYISSDFGHHPVAQLLAGVLEHHDRSKFEIVAWSTVPHRGTLQTRIATSVEHFVDASGMNDEEALRTLRDTSVHIAVDLNGYSLGCRPLLFARRAAPVQVNYLGYPGTLGADFMDYMIADRIVIPNEDDKFYSERIVRMPDCFMPADSKRELAPNLTRRDAGLPESAFVFCDFNDAYKITPALFDIWMSLLRQVEGSVLWLRGVVPVGMDNLKREAERRGISADRIIFAKTVESNAEYVARFALADLFLDTLPYNAHATANEALWAGLPMVTCLGKTFAGRVAASQLHAVGLPELVTTSWQEYEALALKLARDPALLAQVRAKLANRKTSALFDTARYTRHLEAAYTTMWERALRGEAPASFAVDPL